jgi:hypothetical protein
VPVPGRDGGVEAVDVEGQVVVHALGDTGQHRLDPQFADLADGKDVVAHRAGGLIAVLGGGTDVADAKRGDALDVVLFGGAAHRVAVAVADAVAHIDEIKVGVDLDDMERATRKGADAGDVDRMVAAKDDRDRPGGKDGADAGFDVGVEVSVSVWTMSASPMSTMRTPSR